MCFYYFLRFFGPLFDIHIFVGVAEMMKIAENSLRNRRFFDDFSAVFRIFATPDIEWISKIYSKNHSRDAFRVV